MSEIDLDALRYELSDFVVAAQEAPRAAVEERVLMGFEEIQRWVAATGRMPQNEEGRDIFERLYAVRLDRLRGSDQLRVLIEPIDHDGILAGTSQFASAPVALSMDDLAAELADINALSSDITELRHVRPRSEIRAAEDIATRQPCAEFEIFRPLFKVVQEQIRTGLRKTVPFAKESNSASVGDFFILSGQFVYIAEMGRIESTPEGPNARLRAIFGNGTESKLLLRSLQNSLYKDETARRVTEPDSGPLFAAVAEEGESATGTVYVLRSNSDVAEIASRRELIHKIGVTGGDVSRRIANAKLDATFLLSDVEVVTTYVLYDINRTKLENLLHRFFEPARLEITIADRFGNLVSPKEWFLVPLFIIDEAIERIRDGSLAGYRYDPEVASIVRVEQ